MKILFFGDIVGKIGRSAIKQVLPELKKEYEPDFVIANGENIAHGKGLTQATVAEVIASGVDLLTSGDHIADKPAYEEIVSLEEPQVIRPANFPEAVPGTGYRILKKNDKTLVILNLMGRVFMRRQLDDPFRKAEELLIEINKQTKASVIIDFHAEATSEKAGLAWLLDGRVAAVLGTHTHVPTADARLLPQGTAFISDVGMVGARDSILGVEIAGPLKQFQTQLSGNYEPVESGPVQVNSVLVEIDESSRKAIKIERVDRLVTVK